MEQRPSDHEQVAARIASVLQHATDRWRLDPLYHVIYQNGEGYKSLDQLVDSRLSRWDFNHFTYSGNRNASEKDAMPVEVHDTSEILSLPDEVLDELGPKAPMLRGYLANFEGNKEEAMEWFELAQSGFLHSGDMGSFATSSSKLARTAREVGFLEAAEEAHRNAIYGYMKLEDERNEELIVKGMMEPTDVNSFSLKVFYEYRSLARTLGTITAIQKYGNRELLALREEVLALSPVATSEAVYGILVLMQIEKELASCSSFGSMHRNRAKRYGFICQAADCGGGAGLEVLIRTLEDGKVPRQRTASISEWLSTFSRDAPDVVIGGINYYNDDDRGSW